MIKRLRQILNFKQKDKTLNKRIKLKNKKDKTLNKNIKLMMKISSPVFVCDKKRIFCVKKSSQEIYICNWKCIKL